jgi:glycosyltransferase involved in cell wall biosynthesis
VKVLRVTPTLDPEMGGPQSTFVNVAIAERRAGLEPTVIFTGDRRSVVSTAPARDRLQAAGIPALMFPRSRVLPSAAACRWGVSGPMSVWLLRNAHRYDVVHVDYVWGWSTLVAAVAAARGGRPVVMTAHESLTRFNIEKRSGSTNSNASLRTRAKLRMRTLLMRYIDLVVMTSELEKADSMTANERAVVIPFPVAAEPLMDATGEPDFPPLVVGYIGRLHPKKNVDVLLRAVAELGASATVIVCGDGDPGYRAELHRLADTLSLAERVEWRGHVDAVGRARLFAESHVVAMPSTYESFGMAAAEAMAAGVPVIVSRSTGVAQVVERYDCGRLVRAGEVGELRAALASTAGDASWRHQARRNALRAASAAFSYESYGAHMTAIYSDLVAHYESRKPKLSG